jgi:ATP-dependent Clp protease ATP-binding subunit ClpA
MLVADQARAVVYHAIAAARRSNAAVVDTGHLLAGVIAARDTVVLAVWHELGVDPGRLRDALIAAGGHGGTPAERRRRAPTSRRSAVLAGRMPGPHPAAFSAGARRVLGDALVLARAHGANRLRPGHLLLAIAAQREDDPARGLLSTLDVDLTALVHAVCVRLAGGTREGPAAVTPAVPASDPRPEHPARDR